MATGASDDAMLLVGDIAGEAAVRRGLGPDGALVLAVGIFFLLMRLLPLSGTHGAEHQVVHAIEREESLTPDVFDECPSFTLDAART